MAVRGDAHFSIDSAAAGGFATGSDALALAVRGFKLFRLRHGTKEGFIDTDWAARPLGDAWSVGSAFEAEPTANIGVHAGASDLVIIDCDVKHGDGDALFQSMGEVPRTFTVRTPSGGRHYYFQAAGVTYSQRPLAARMIDVRSGNGYVIGPGSTVNGRAYSVECDSEPAPLPTWLLARLAERNLVPYTTAQAVKELDTPEAVAAAYDYLTKYAPAGDEGGRNNASVPVLHKCMDFGLSPDMAAEMAGDYWPCDWSDDFTPEGLLPIAQRLAASRQKPLGVEHPSEGFVAVKADPSPAPQVAERPRAALRDAVRPLAISYDGLKHLPRRAWIVPGFLERGELAALIAPGGVGKSLLTLHFAIAAALGGCARMAVDVRDAVRVLMLSTEDRVPDLQRRLCAACLQHGLDPETIDVHAYDSERGRLVLAEPDGARGRRKGAGAAELEALICEGGYGLVVADPLVKFHGLNENDNGDMNFVVDALRDIAARTRAAVLIVHHTRKPAGGAATGHEGNIDAARGGSAFRDGVRIAKTLTAMDRKTATENGVPEGDRWRYVRLDDAKQNHSPQRSEPEWYCKTSVPLPNGDEAPCLVPWRAAEGGGLTPDQIELVHGELVRMTSDGSWERYTNNPKNPASPTNGRAGGFLPKVLAGLPALAGAGLHADEVARALGWLQSEGRAELVLRGRGKDGKQPERWRAVRA